MDLKDDAATAGQAGHFTDALADLLEPIGMDRAALEALLVEVASRRTSGPGSGEAGAVYLELAWSQDPRQVQVGPSTAWEAAAVAALNVAIFSTRHTWPGLAIDSGSGERLTVLRGPQVADAREMSRAFAASA